MVDKVTDFVGDDFEAPDEIKLPDPIEHKITCMDEEFIIKVFKEPKKNCRKCYGRGHRGMYNTTRLDDNNRKVPVRYPLICSCIEKVRYIEPEEFEQMKEVAEAMDLI